MAALTIGNYAQNSSNYGANNVGGLTVTNLGTIFQNVSEGTTGGPVYALLLQQLAGAGTNVSEGDNANSGGVADGASPGASVDNQAAITVSGDFGTQGGAALRVEASGGNGGSVASIGPDHNGNPQYNGGNGGSGGQSSVAIVQNSGAITAGSNQTPITGSTGYVGIDVLDTGGAGGAGSRGAAGGQAPTVEIDNSAPVTINWAQAGNSPSPSGVYGIRGQSTGGAGALSVTSGVNGGMGGDLSATTVQLLPGGNVIVNVSGDNTAFGAGVAAQSIGGAGGAGYDSSTGGTGGTAFATAVQADGSTAYIPAATVGVSGASVATSGPGIVGIAALATGGAGGRAASGRTTAMAAMEGGPAAADPRTTRRPIRRRRSC